jgi:hypothetical protein
VFPIEISQFPTYLLNSEYEFIGPLFTAEEFVKGQLAFLNVSSAALPLAIYLGECVGCVS